MEQIMGSGDANMASSLLTRSTRWSGAVAAAELFARHPLQPGPITHMSCHNPMAWQSRGLCFLTILPMMKNFPVETISTSTVAPVQRRTQLSVCRDES